LPTFSGFEKEPLLKESLRFRPRLLDSLVSYKVHDLGADVGAGVTVGIVALSLAMALGIASGSTPAAGIYTAIVAGFLIATLGGSKVQIGGPTAAFIPIVVKVASDYGLANLAICTLLAGAMLMAMGLARMGTMIKFIPFPVTAGFTADIAVVIFSTQVKDFLGLKLEKNSGEFMERLWLLYDGLRTINWTSAALAAGFACPDQTLARENRPTLARLHRRRRAGHARRGDIWAKRLDDWQQLRQPGHPAQPADASCTGTAFRELRRLLGAVAKPHPSGIHHRAAGRHRIAAVRRGG
jgi:hypothetical protein